MAMADDQERDDLAAEYVLGTLDRDERAAAERQIVEDGKFAMAVARWEHRLAPLLDAVPSQSPSADLWRRIENRIARLDGATVLEIDWLQRRADRWRRVALTMGAVAAALAGLFTIREVWRPLPQQRFVAVLETADRQPAFVASVELGTGRVTLLRVGPEPASGRSYELWALGAGRERPQSLGVVDSPSAPIPAERLGAMTPAVLRDTTFAVSLEPSGGSPTGQPTGPVLFTGKLVPAPAAP